MFSAVTTLFFIPFKTDSLIAKSISDAYYKLDSLTLLIADLKGQMFLDSLNELSLSSQIQTLYYQVKALNLELENIYASLQIEKNGRLNESELRNTAVIPENFTEYLDKSINTYYRDYLREDFQGFSSFVQQHIDSISTVCPLLGGDAVFRARSLQATYNDTLFYQDTELCNQQGVYYRLSQQQQVDQFESVAEKLLLFPNPAKEFLNVHLTSDNKDGYTVSIYNVLGQKIFEKANCVSSFVLPLSALQLRSGLYFFEMRHVVSNLLYKQKFIIR